MVTAVSSATTSVTTAMTSDVLGRDATIAWFRGEFAAANAIIDALCNHLKQIDGGYRHSEYQSVFSAIHRRRLNWIPILQTQKYYSISDIVIELKRVISDGNRQEDEIKQFCEAEVTVPYGESLVEESKRSEGDGVEESGGPSDGSDLKVSEEEEG